MNTTGDIDEALDNLRDLRSCPEKLGPKDVEDQLPEKAWLDRENVLWVDTSDNKLFESQTASLTPRRKEILEDVIEHEGSPYKTSKDRDVSHRYISQIFEAFHFIVRNEDLQEAFLEGRWDTSQLRVSPDDYWMVDGKHVEDVDIYEDLFAREEWADIVQKLHERGGEENKEKARQIMMKIL